MLDVTSGPPILISDEVGDLSKRESEYVAPRSVRDGPETLDRDEKIMAS